MGKRIRQRVNLGEKVVWVSGFTQQETLLKAAQLLLDHGLLDSQQEIRKNTPLFETYAEEWLMLYKAGKLKHTTFATYKNQLVKHIYPFFGKLQVGEINTNIIQQFINTKSHYSHATVRHMKIILHEIFGSALEDGFITTNPTESNRLSLPTRVTQRNALPLVSFADIKEHLNDLVLSDKVMLSIYMFTGVRRGEGLGLKWEDISWREHLIFVQRSVTFKNNQPVIGSPKSIAGIRIIPLNQMLETMLMSQISEGYIIGNGVSPMTECTFNRTWERIGRTIDLHGATPHILRHTYITLAASSGIDVKTLQSIAGHADISTTMNRYAHSRPEKIKEARLLIDDVFGGV